MKAKNSLWQTTQAKNRARLEAGEPLPNLKRTKLRNRSKKKKRTNREIDLEFLKFVRRHACAVTGCVNQTQAHHLKTRASGGSDYTAVPLCGVHHTYDYGVHPLGLTRFEQLYELDLWSINKQLLERYEMTTEKDSTVNKEKGDTKLQVTKGSKGKKRTGVTQVSSGKNARISAPKKK